MNIYIVNEALELSDWQQQHHKSLTVIKTTRMEIIVITYSVIILSKEEK